MLGIVSPYVNLTGNSLVKEEFLVFRKQMSEYPLFTVELNFGGTSQVNSFLQVEGASLNYVFQPERLLNMVVKHLPDNIDSIAWVDSRMVLLNPDWYGQASDALGQARIVQLISNVRWLDQEGLLEPAAGIRECPFGGLPLRTGAAWAMQREAFEQLGGLFAWDIVGNGNAWIQSAFSGETSNRFLRLASSGMYDEFMAYSQRCRQLLQGKGRVLQGDALQRFRGYGAERVFWLRHEWLGRSGLWPGSGIQESEGGLLEWERSSSLLQDRYRSVMGLPALP